MKVPNFLLIHRGLPGGLPMKTHALYLPFFALLCSTLSSMGGVQASPSAVDSVHFCLNDSEHWSRDRARRPAAKRLADLNVGKPRTVRMIYFLPIAQLKRARNQPSNSSPRRHTRLPQRVSLFNSKSEIRMDFTK